MLAKAIELAATAHVYQSDKAGKPYILHPIRVMMRLRSNDEGLMTIAILHDVVEDSSVTLDDLRNQGFDDRVISALDLLTHDDDSDYETYIDAMQHNVDALLVKREDLRDNSDITRLKGLRQKDFDRLEKYSRAFVKIEGFLKQYGL